MAILGNVWFKLETLETLVETLKAKNQTGIALDFALNDKANDWGQNVSVSVQQTKEQREAKVKRFYVGNGKVTWTNGVMPQVIKRENVNNQKASESSDLPF